MVNLQLILLAVIFIEVLAGVVVILMKGRSRADEYKKLKSKWTFNMSDQSVYVIMLIAGTLIFASIISNSSREGTPQSAIQAGLIPTQQDCDTICFNLGYDFGLCKNQCDESDYDHGYRGCDRNSVCCCKYSVPLANPP